MVSGRAQPGAVLLRPEAADFGASCAEAEAQGAVAVIFAAERGAERPFGYRHDRAPPGGDEQVRLIAMMYKIYRYL